ncbi:MAG: type VI secretion system tip protein VgrG [Bacteroidota bacterium]
MNNERVIPQEGTYDLVTHSILIDGSEIPSTVEVLSLVLSREVNKIPLARIILKDGDPADEDFVLSSTDDFIPGKEISISIGHDSLNTVLFEGIITKHSIAFYEDKGGVLVLEARDASVKMTIGRKNKYFIEQSDSEVWETIIGEYGLIPEVEATTLTHKELVQFYVTDWDFLVARAEANGKLVWIDQGTVFIRTPDSSTQPVLELIYGATMLEFEGASDARYQYQAVKASSWDYTNQQLLETEGAARLQMPGNFNNDELAQVSSPSKFELRHSGQVIEDELQAWADACVMKSQLAKVIGRVKFDGFAEVTPGTVIKLAGLGTRFNGNAYVTAIRHEVFDGTWHTHAQFGKKPTWFHQENMIEEGLSSGIIPGIQGLQIGVVSQLQDDPDGEDRILVKLPIIDVEAEGVWARVSCLDAGENRGSFFRPEIGDEVVVGFLNNDPRDAIVLGMLNSSNKPAPLIAQDDNHIKGFVTRSEMKLLFDDETSIITVETPAGNKVVISDDEQLINLTDQHGNSIMLNADGITLDSIADIVIRAAQNIEISATQNLTEEGGVNVELSAGVGLKAEGGATAELTGAASTTIKGGIVQIN